MYEQEDNYDLQIVTSPIADDGKFHIVDNQTAQWYVAKITMMRKEIEIIKQQADKRIKSIESNIKSMEFRFDGELRKWAIDESTRINAKTIRLSHGSVQVSNHEASARIVNPDLIPFKDKFLSVSYDTRGMMKEAAKYIVDKLDAETGELVPTLEIPGAQLVPKHINVVILKEKSATEAAD